MLIRKFLMNAPTNTYNSKAMGQKGYLKLMALGLLWKNLWRDELYLMFLIQSEF